MEHSSQYWTDKAIQAEKDLNIPLAIEYYEKAAATALGVGRKQRAIDAVDRLGIKTCITQ